MRGYYFIALMLIAPESFSQSPDMQSVRNWRMGHESALIREFTAFLAIPNVASDSLNISRIAAFIQAMMEDRKITHVQLLSGDGGGYPPAVYGEVLVPGASQTIGLYAHYDGQPVNPAQWAPGLSPFSPVLYDGPLFKSGKPIPFPAGTNAAYDPEWRIYARGASDDKAGVFAILSALAALESTGLQPTCNLKFLFEGEEEAGSIHLGDILRAHAGLLKADCWVICDGPVHQTGRKQIVFGVRGDTHLDLTVYGPKRPLHSGHYGNWATNPALLLAKLLASMKDDSGRVTIKGFYDDVQPLSPIEQKALAEVPSVDEQMEEELGMATTEMTGKSLSEAINLPSLNINGMQSGNIGSQTSNQIPTYATAVLDLRLVLGNDWRRQQQKIIDHIRRQGFMVLDRDPTDAERRKYPKIAKVLSGTGSYNAQRTSMDLPIGKSITAALQSTTSEPVILQPTMGGSLPLYLFEQYLHAHPITVPIANHDNNQHAENENIRLANLWSGIESMAAIMRMKADSTVIPLWPNGAPGFEQLKNKPEQAEDWWVRDINNPTLTVFGPAPGRANGAAIILCPGGGFLNIVFNSEGRNPAKFLDSLGITVFVLKYRLFRMDHSPYTQENPTQDIFRAMRLVKSRAAEFHLDTAKIGVMGFSAGGEVAGWVSYRFHESHAASHDAIDNLSARPAFQILIYPGPFVFRTAFRPMPRLPFFAPPTRTSVAPNLPSGCWNYIEKPTFPLNCTCMRRAPMPSPWAMDHRMWSCNTGAEDL